MWEDEVKREEGPEEQEWVGDSWTQIAGHIVGNIEKRFTNDYTVKKH